MWFYLAAAIGKVQIDQDMVMVISMQSPFGAALIGKKSGEMVSVNGQGYRILQLL
jgi:transcription elongation GreA/GreB family factor